MGITDLPKYANKWNNFWENWENSKGSKPKGCVFTVAMTLTQKTDKSSQSPLVQSYAAVANAESYERRKCREKGKKKCAEKHKGCSENFLYVADMIARDALTSTRFALAQQLLTS